MKSWLILQSIMEHCFYFADIRKFQPDRKCQNAGAKIFWQAHKVFFRRQQSCAKGAGFAFQRVKLIAREDVMVGEILHRGEGQAFLTAEGVKFLRPADARESEEFRVARKIGGERGLQSCVKDGLGLH
jgi:hypothetical protein